MSLEAVNQMKVKTGKIIGGAVLAAALLFAGVTYFSHGQTENKAAEVPAEDEVEQAAPALPAHVLAADDFSNLAPSMPDIPVFDRYTLAERREKGLPTTLPDIVPYREGKVAYLTFDDGPDAQNTPAVLDILKEAGVHATFYVTGRQAEAHPEVLQRIYAEGHAIGNHSYDHRYEKLYPDVNGFLAEMEKTDAVIQGIIGVRPLILRAPGGDEGLRCGSACQRLCGARLERELGRRRSESSRGTGFYRQHRERDRWRGHGTYGDHPHAFL